MDADAARILARAAREHGTPCYVYLVDRIRRRVESVREAFGGRFGISYAVKANPSVPLIGRLLDLFETLDASSIGEVERGLHAGCPAGRITFSGPAKRREELARAVEVGVGEMVCESVRELETLDELAGSAGRRVGCLLRINPARAPKQFGVSMAGKASQFGIDEEDADAVLERFGSFANLDLLGFHIYSGTNSLSVEAIDENFGIFIELFTRFSEAHGLAPSKLIFGSGFGIPYHEGDEPLDLSALAPRILERVDAMRRNARLAEADLTLEMGRYLVGPEGYLLTTVVGEKRSRGTEIRLCDAGFNNQLAACGMMGTIIRRNWMFWNLSAEAGAPAGEYVLAGPLCTTIDLLAREIELPRVEVGHVLAVGSSGAYGLTSSPSRFISHPEPLEILAVGGGESAELIDASERPVRQPERRFDPAARVADHV